MGGIEGEMHQTGRALDTAMTRSESLPGGLRAADRAWSPSAASRPTTRRTSMAAHGSRGADRHACSRRPCARARSRPADLFDEAYKPIPGTNPAQHTTRFIDARRPPVPAGAGAHARPVRQGRVLHRGRPQRLRRHAQQEVQPPAARRRGVGHGEQPLPPHLQRPHRPGIGAQHAAVPAADLPPRHGRRQVRRDEGSGRADHA